MSGGTIINKSSNGNALFTDNSGGVILSGGTLQNEVLGGKTANLSGEGQLEVTNVTSTGEFYICTINYSSINISGGTFTANPSSNEEGSIESNALCIDCYGNEDKEINISRRYLYCKYKS